jgi:hypothetical protein
VGPYILAVMRPQRNRQCDVFAGFVLVFELSAAAREWSVVATAVPAGFCGGGRAGEGRIAE